MRRLPQLWTIERRGGRAFDCEKPADTFEQEVHSSPHPGQPPQLRHSLPKVKSPAIARLLAKGLLGSVEAYAIPPQGGLNGSGQKDSTNLTTRHNRKPYFPHSLICRLLPRLRSRSLSINHSQSSRIQRSRYRSSRPLTASTLLFSR
jgi:hypothetical protein